MIFGFFDNFYLPIPHGKWNTVVLIAPVINNFRLLPSTTKIDWTLCTNNEDSFLIGHEHIY